MGLKAVLTKEFAEHENEASKVVGRHQLSHCNPDLCCVGEALEFWLLICHFMPNGICFQFHPSYHAVMVLLVLEATVMVLPIPQVPLFEVDIAMLPTIGFFQAVLVVSPI